jgi:hypothetical protein
MVGAVVMGLARAATVVRVARTQAVETEVIVALIVVIGIAVVE